MNYNKIGFVGLGLIGGSIAKAIKKFYPHMTMMATASRESTVVAAYADGTIINSKIPADEDFRDCDIIFLCCPVKINIDYMKRLKNVISKDCILTDVGSVKGDITAAAQELGLSSQFIGGHPMTGSEKTGYDSSTPTLLENSYYILTSESVIEDARLNEFETFISSLGPITIKIDSALHDKSTALISHMPHVIAAAIVNTVKNNDSENEIAKTIAAGGFRDTTRIASSSPVMWEHISMNNRDALLNAIRAFKSELESFEQTIEESDGAAFNKLFTESKNYRDSITVSGKKPILMVHELYTYIDDAQGTILPVLVILDKAKLSIKNMDIVHNREFEPGVLRIEFYTHDVLEQAAKVLSENGYEIHIRN